MEGYVALTGDDSDGTMELLPTSITCTGVGRFLFTYGTSAKVLHGSKTVRFAPETFALSHRYFQYRYQNRSCLWNKSLSF